jgi:hypothetical protein
MYLITIINNAVAANNAKNLSDSDNKGVAWVMAITCVVLVCCILYDFYDKFFSKDKW